MAIKSVSELQYSVAPSNYGDLTLVNKKWVEDQFVSGAGLYNIVQTIASNAANAVSVTVDNKTIKPGESGLYVDATSVGGTSYKDMIVKTDATTGKLTKSLLPDLAITKVTTIATGTEGGKVDGATTEAKGHFGLTTVEAGDVVVETYTPSGGSLTTDIWMYTSETSNNASVAGNWIKLEAGTLSTRVSTLENAGYISGLSGTSGNGLSVSGATVTLAAAGSPSTTTLGTAGSVQLATYATNANTTIKGYWASSSTNGNKYAATPAGVAAYVAAQNFLTSISLSGTTGNGLTVSGSTVSMAAAGSASASSLGSAGSVQLATYSTSASTTIKGYWASASTDGNKYAATPAGVAAYVDSKNYLTSVSLTGTSGNGLTVNGLTVSMAVAGEASTTSAGTSGSVQLVTYDTSATDTVKGYWSTSGGSNSYAVTPKGVAAYIDSKNYLTSVSLSGTTGNGLTVSGSTVSLAAAGSPTTTAVGTAGSVQLATYAVGANSTIKGYWASSSTNGNKYAATPAGVAAYVADQSFLTSIPSATTDALGGVTVPSLGGLSVGTGSAAGQLSVNIDGTSVIRDTDDGTISATAYGVFGSVKGAYAAANAYNKYDVVFSNGIPVMLKAAKAAGSSVTLPSGSNTGNYSNANGIALVVGATSSTYGLVKGDGTTITTTNGVVSLYKTPTITNWTTGKTYAQNELVYYNDTIYQAVPATHTSASSNAPVANTITTQWRPYNKYTGEKTVAASTETGETPVGVQHSLNTKDIVVQVYQVDSLSSETSRKPVLVDYEFVDENNINLLFASPRTNASYYRIVILAAR